MKLSIEELRAKATKFQRRIRRRNLREYAASLLVIGLFSWYCWKVPNPVERLGFALVVAGAIYYAWHLWKWGAPRFLPSDLGRADCLEFYRGELKRQRDLLRSVWWWAIGPIIPGLAVGFFYGIVTGPAAVRLHQIVGAAVAAGIIVCIGWLNQRAAHHLDGRIAELDREVATRA